MMDVKYRAISGVLWSSVQQFGVVGFAFIGNLVLARLLSPDDFGCIGLLYVFISIANTFIDGGFGLALIQKKEPTNKDYSTIFYWNLAVAIVCYIGLYISAPFISAFYNVVSLSDLLRVLGLILILNAFSIVQINQQVKRMNFRKMAPIYLCANFLGITIGIIAAYLGLGIWSLIIQQIIINSFITVSFWIFGKWRPMRCFDKESFRGLFNYGSMVFLTSMIQTLYTNIQSLIIGRVFSTGILGYYTQAQKLENVPVQTLTQIVNQVTFPLYSGFQDDVDRLRENMRKSLKVISYINFGLMALLIIIAPSVFRLLFTEKWNDSIPLFQMLCLANMLYTVTTTNLNAIRAAGRSDVTFYGQLVKKSIGLVLVFIGISFGIYGLMWALVFDMYFHVLINAFLAKKVLRYSVIEQFTDLFPCYFLALIVAVIVYYATSFIQCHYIVLLILQSVVFLSLYIWVSYLFSIEGYILICQIIKDKMKK